LGAPTLTAPATGRPCSVWELTLVEIIPGDYDSNEGADHLWTGFRSADLPVEFDARVVVRQRPRRGHPYDITFGHETVTVPGERVVASPNGGPALSIFHGVGQLPANPAVLQAVGVPEQLIDRVRARPERFYLREGSIAPGELISLVQQTR